MNIVKITRDTIDEELEKLYIEGYNYHVNGRPDIFKFKSDDILKENLKEELDECTLLAIEEDNKKVGFLSYHYNEKHTKVLWVDQLVIAQNYRKKGYGKILMDKVKEIAKKENCIRVELCCWDFNKDAMDMYEHIGFSKQRTILEQEL